MRKRISDQIRKRCSHQSMIKYEKRKYEKRKKFGMVKSVTLM